MYEKLLKEVEEEKLDLIEIKMQGISKGFYCDGVIAINKKLSNTEKACVLCEELGHYYTSHGDILDQSNINSRKQELKARKWGYERLVGIVDLVNAYKEGIRNRYELSEYLDVTEEFIDECLKYYKEKHGLFYEIDEYIVYFEPLGVFKRLF